MFVPCGRAIDSIRLLCNAVYSAPFTYDAEKGFQLLESSPPDLTPYL
jgi:hypothetical protein